MAAKYSYAKRAQVGTIIVKDDQILSVGINGTPRGWESNECEFIDNLQQIVTKPEVLHSEANAIAKLTKCTIGAEGASLFVTHSPCLPCAKIIMQSGIIEVFYLQDYGNSDGINFLKKCNVSVIKLKGN